MINATTAHLTPSLRMKEIRFVRVVQSVEPLTHDFSSGHGLRGVILRPMLGSTLGVEPT